MSDEQAESATEPVDADTADDPDAETETETDTSGLQEGDFVRLDYTVRTVDDDQVIDTTRQDVAEEAGLDEEGHEFEPRTLVIGAGHLFEDVDEDLIGREVGESNTVHIDAVDAFGAFDPDEVRTVSAEKIDEDDRYPGARVTIDGQQGHVETIIGGRARVDFNHPLAGEDLEYEYEILDVVDDREEQAKSLLGMHLDHAPEVWIETDEVEEEVQVEVEGDEEGEPEYETETQTVEKETLYIEATPQMTMNQQWLFQKQQIAQQIMDRLDLDRVIVQETIDGTGGMMGGMGGMMGGMGGAGGAEVEEALEEADIDADEIVEEIEEGDGDIDLEE